MSIREINDQYKEYADPYEPVKGRKSHGGIAIVPKLRMQQAARAAAASILAIAILTTVILTGFFHLSARAFPQSASAHEAEFSYIVDTSDFAKAGVYYTLTDPEGILIASAQITSAADSLRFSDLKENTEYTLTLYDKNGKKLDAATLTTADDPNPIPEIIDLTATYDRLTETVTIYGRVNTNDANDFTAALSSSDFDLDSNAVTFSISEDGIAHIRYSGKHPLTLGIYNASLTVGYTLNDSAQEQMKHTSFPVADMVINGFSGTVGDNKSIALSAIATHHHTDAEPYEVRSAVITAKQIYSGRTFDVPATFIVNGDQITVKAATASLESGKYRFNLEIGYTIDGTDAPVLTAAALPIDIMVPYPAPVVTPTPTPTPTPAPAYTDLEIDEAATSANWDTDFYIYSGVILNDAKNVTGSVTIEAAGLQAGMTLTDNGDGTMDAVNEPLSGAVPPGQYEAVIRFDYTVNGQARSKTTTRTVSVGTIRIDTASRSGNNTTMTAHTDVGYLYEGPDGPYTITAVRADLYDAAQNLVTSFSDTPPAADPGHFYYAAAEFSGLTDTVYYVQWVIDYSIGSGSSVCSATAASDLLRIDLINPAYATMPPSAQYSASQTGSGAALTFTFYSNGGKEITGLSTFINGVDAAAAGYTVTENLANASGTVTVSGPYSGLTEVAIEYRFILVNSDTVQTETVRGYLDIGYFTGYELYGITVTPNGDGTATVSGSIRTDNTAPTSVTNVVAKVIGADSTEYAGGIDSAVTYDGIANNGTFSMVVTLPPAGDYTIYLEALGASDHGYPYNINLHGQTAVAQTVTP
ncbi:MAG: hypothetical protein IJD81_00115 [Oscillospiraceae bacterium]|nr:hypothetical protein [Oscillospiraceae bacterium]